MIAWAGCWAQPVLDLGSTPDAAPSLTPIAPDDAGLKDAWSLDRSPEAMVSAHVARDGVFVLEAEDYDQAHAGQGAWAQHRWVLGDQPMYLQGSVGPGYMTPLPELGANVGLELGGPRLDHLIWTPAPVTLWIWVRLWAASGSDNAVHVGAQGQGATTSRWGMRVPPGPLRGQWSWIGHVSDDQGAQRAQLTLDGPGLHTIHVWMRDDGSRLDRIILHPDPEFAPEGQGPQRSPRAWVEGALKKDEPR